MARLPRFTISGYPQHVIQRGNNRERIFHREHDYRFFLDKLGDCAPRQQVDIHAYVLMTNHVHLLMTPYTADGIGRLMQSLGRSYVRYFNDRYERTGTLWEGRYKATLVDEEAYLLNCYRYIELNPVRAGLVDDPGAYRWSSYRANALGRADDLVTPHSVYQRLGKEESDRQLAYRQLCASALSEQTLKAIRESTNKSRVLGDGAFERKIEEFLKRRLAPVGRGGDRRSEAYRQWMAKTKRL